MPIVPLLAQSAFDPETIETLVSVFEAAWRKVEQSGSKLASPAYKRAAQEIIAKRIIEMTDRGLTDVPELRDDALAFLQNNPPVRVIVKGSAENHWTGARAVSLAELGAKRLRQCERLRALTRRMISPSLACPARGTGSPQVPHRKENPDLSMRTPPQ